MCETEREKPCEWDCVHNRYCHLVRWRGIHKNDKLRQIDHNCVKRRNRTLFYMFTLFLSRYYSHVHTFLWKQSKNIARTLQIMCFFCYFEKVNIATTKKANDFHRKSIIIYLYEFNWFFGLWLNEIRSANEETKTHTQRRWFHFYFSVSFCFNNSPLYIIISHSLCGDFNFNFQFKSFPIKFHLLNGKRRECVSVLGKYGWQLVGLGKLAVFVMFLLFLRLLALDQNSHFNSIGLKIKWWFYNTIWIEW